MSCHQESPYVMKRKKHSELFYEGYCIDFLKELARNLKFTYEIYTTPDGKYGAEMEDGTWNGVVGEILNKVWFKISNLIRFTDMLEHYLTLCSVSSKKTQSRFF